MEVVRLILQVLLLIATLIIIGTVVKQRKQYETKQDFYINLGTTIVLLLWLMGAGSFDKFLF